VYVGLHVLFQDIQSVTNNLEILSVIEDIKLSCNDAVNILDGILHFNELDEGIAKVKLSAVKLKSFLKGVVHPFYREASRMNLTLKYFDDVDDNVDPLFLVIDKQKVGVVMRSLLESSLHLAPEHGSVEVTLSLVSDDAEPPDDLPQNGKPVLHRTSYRAENYLPKGCMLRVTFRDTGPGISKVAEGSLTPLMFVP
jgi:signal transduction histidine kinase